MESIKRNKLWSLTYHFNKDNIYLLILQEPVFIWLKAFKITTQKLLIAINLYITLRSVFITALFYIFRLIHHNAILTHLS